MHLQVQRLWLRQERDLLQFCPLVSSPCCQQTQPFPISTSLLYPLPNTHMHTRLHTLTHMHTGTHTHARVLPHACTHKCSHVHAHTGTHRYTHAHTHTTFPDAEGEGGMPYVWAERQKSRLAPCAPPPPDGLGAGPFSRSPLLGDLGPGGACSQLTAVSSSKPPLSA